MRVHLLASVLPILPSGHFVYHPVRPVTSALWLVDVDASVICWSDLPIICLEDTLLGVGGSVIFLSNLPDIHTSVLVGLHQDVEGITGFIHDLGVLVMVHVVLRSTGCSSSMV